MVGKCYLVSVGSSGYKWVTISQWQQVSALYLWSIWAWANFLSSSTWCILHCLVSVKCEDDWVLYLPSNSSSLLLVTGLRRGYFVCQWQTAFASYLLCPGLRQFSASPRVTPDLTLYSFRTWSMNELCLISLLQPQTIVGSIHLSPSPRVSSLSPLEYFIFLLFIVTATFSMLYQRWNSSYVSSLLTGPVTPQNSILAASILRLIKNYGSVDHFGFFLVNLGVFFCSFL